MKLLKEEKLRFRGILPSSAARTISAAWQNLENKRVDKIRIPRYNHFS